MRQVKPGDVVKVVFWDHAEDSDETPVCEAFGRVAKVDGNMLVIDSWTTRNYDGIENRKRFALRTEVVINLSLLIPLKD